MGLHNGESTRFIVRLPLGKIAPYHQVLHSWVDAMSTEPKLTNSTYKDQLKQKLLRVFKLLSWYEVDKNILQNIELKNT